MKENNTESDKLKQVFRKKLSEDPAYSDTDEVIWKKVLSEIHEDKEEREGKNYFIWYAAAAVLILCLTVTVKIFFLSETEKPVLADKSLGKEDVKRDTVKIAENVSGKNITETGTKREEKQKESDKALIASKPDFDKAPSVIAGSEKAESNLPDGSVVTLHANSVIKISDNFIAERNILLQGEAYFEVQSDKTRPFRIYFDGYMLEVVGTRFNVRNVAGESVKEVSVSEGIVRVFYEPGAEGILVKQDEQLRIEKGKRPELIKVDADNFISWKTGKLKFRNASMEEVAILMERMYGKKINLELSIKDCKFTGDLSDLTLDEALQVVGMTTSFKIEKNKEKVYISGAGCE